MVSMFRLTKTKEYPQPHDVSCQMQLYADNAVKNCTIIPAIHYDEAMLPSTKKTHPENLAFAETSNSNCCAESKIFRIQCTMRLTLTTGSVDTDKVQALRFAFMSIHGAFEDFDANDELTSATVGDILEITKETTDRQSYPIYDGTKHIDKYTDSAHLGADAVGLTTNTGIENVVFDPDLYYDALNYYTNSNKLKKVQDGLRWITLTHDNPTKLIKFNIKSNTKSMNPYTILAHMIFLPKKASKYQIPITMTSIAHMTCEYRCRYLEWNSMFLFHRVDPA